MKRLLDEGANPNEARFVGFAPIFFPVMNQNGEMFRVMVEHVSSDAPPLFIAVAYDDNPRMTNTATGLLENWKKAKVPAELHVFADGGHGFGMNKKGKACDVWTDLLAQWMTRMGLLSKT